MPGFTFPGRPDVEHDEPLLDMIFDRRPLPPTAPPEMHDLARMLAVAAGPAERGELAGEAAALAAFSHSASPAGILPSMPPTPGPARRRWFRLPGDRGSSRVRGRIRVAVALTVTAALGGTAAYAGVLPGPLQRVAHAAVGAPAPPIEPPAKPRPHPHRHPHPSPAPERAAEPAKAPRRAVPTPANSPTGRDWRYPRVHQPGCPYPRPGYPSWVSSCPPSGKPYSLTPGGNLTSPLQPPYGGTVPRR